MAQGPSCHDSVRVPLTWLGSLYRRRLSAEQQQLATVTASGISSNRTDSDSLYPHLYELLGHPPLILPQNVARRGPRRVPDSS